MVKIMENPYVQMDDLGGKPTIFGKHPYIFSGWHEKSCSHQDDCRMSLLTVGRNAVRI